jgi:hypothetical protein
MAKTAMTGASKPSSSSQSTTENVQSETTVVNSGTNFSISHSSFQLTIHKLNGKIYMKWA